MPLTPIVNKAYWLFAAAGAAYFVFISLLLNENIQRLYVETIAGLCGRFDVVRFPVLTSEQCSLCSSIQHGMVVRSEPA